MNIPDLINSSFILIASLMLWKNVIALRQHKEVKGVSILATGFFALLGTWNIFYYIYLNQPISLAMNIVALTANVTWLYLVVLYKEKSNEME